MIDDFEWDPGKARLNLSKHKVSFETSIEIFNGPRMEYLDTRTEYSEERYVSYGEAAGRCIVVVHTPRGDKTRIISARKATNSEQIKYFKEVYDED